MASTSKAPQMDLEKAARVISAQKSAAKPPIKNVIFACISELADRNGSSYSAIKKMMVAKYAVNLSKISHFIKKELKVAVETGALLNVAEGRTGLNGKFKLPKSKPKAKDTKPTKTAAKKPKVAADAAPKIKKKPMEKKELAGGAVKEAKADAKAKKAQKKEKPAPKQKKAAKATPKAPITKKSGKENAEVKKTGAKKKRAAPAKKKPEAAKLAEAVPVKKTRKGAA